MTEKQEPTDHIEVNFTDGTSKKVFMSFGLINCLSQVVGGLEQLPFIYSESSLREVLITSSLSDRAPDGSIPKPEEFDEIGQKLTVAEGERLLSWIEDHLASFFIRSLQRLKVLAERGNNLKST